MPDEDGYAEPKFQEDTVREYMTAAGLTPAQVERIVGDYQRAYYTAGSVEGIDAKTDLEGWMQNKVRQYSSATPRTPSYVDTARGTDTRSDENLRTFEAVQQMARDAAARRRQIQQDNFYKGARIDHGPVMDPDVIANTLATGEWTDGDGNYIDPKTGQQVEEPIQADANTIWHQIKGQRFNMGALAIPGMASPAEEFHGSRRTPQPQNRGAFTHRSADAMAAGAGYEGPRGITRGWSPQRPKQFVTPSQALSLLSTMSEDYLTQLQLQMYEAGLYEAIQEGARPRWGRADSLTRMAFQQLFVEASLTPDKNIAAVLADLMQDRLDRQPLSEGSPGAGAAAAPDLVLPDFEPTTFNEEEMRSSIDEIATASIGSYLSPEAKEGLIGKLREREVGLQREQYDRDVNRVTEQYWSDLARTGAAGGGEGASFAEIDAFLAALSGQESGGNYGARNAGSGAYGKFQIMPANWPSWAARAGLGRGARQTPENQEIVARQIVMDYFEQFGNWRDVAVAWYSGPGNIASKRYSTRAQSGGPSISRYADSVMERMTGIRRGTGAMPGQGGKTIGGNIYAPIEAFDPMAEAKAAIKAANPAAWAATEWGNRAAEFFGALGSVMGGG